MALPNYGQLRFRSGILKSGPHIHFCLKNESLALTLIKHTWGQLFKKFNLDQNDLDLEIPCFANQDQVTHLTFVPVGFGLDWITLIQIHTFFQISKSGLLVLYGAPKAVVPNPVPGDLHTCRVQFQPCLSTPACNY